MDSRQLLARRVRSLMDGSQRYNDREKLASAAGISPRSVGYILEGNSNPTLNSIEAVARVFGLDVWELLIDDSKARTKLVDRIFGQSGQWEVGDLDRRAVPDRRTGNGAEKSQ